MSGWPQPGISHEGRAPARRALVSCDAAPDGRPRSLRRCWRIGSGRRRARGHPAGHGEAAPRRPASAVGPHDRTVDLPRAGRGMAPGAEPGALTFARQSSRWRHAVGPPPPVYVRPISGLHGADGIEGRRARRPTSRSRPRARSRRRAGAPRSSRASRRGRAGGAFEARRTSADDVSGSPSPDHGSAGCDLTPAARSHGLATALPEADRHWRWLHPHSQHLSGEARSRCERDRREVVPKETVPAVACSGQS